MSNYYPDKWALIKITSPEYGTLIKVMASWYGGWAGSDSWKISSGVTKITKTDSGYEFLNESGSVYFCHKDAYGMSGYTTSIYLDYKGRLEALPETTMTMFEQSEIDSLQL